MAEARRSDAWDHTSAILAMTAEINRDRNRRARPYSAAEFHPFRHDAVGVPQVPFDAWCNAIVAEGQRMRGHDG